MAPENNDRRGYKSILGYFRVILQKLHTEGIHIVNSMRSNDSHKLGKRNKKRQPSRLIFNQHTVVHHNSLSIMSIRKEHCYNYNTFLCSALLVFRLQDGRLTLARQLPDVSVDRMLNISVMLFFFSFWLLNGKTFLSSWDLEWFEAELGHLAWEHLASFCLCQMSIIPNSHNSPMCQVILWQITFFLQNDLSQG